MYIRQRNNLSLKSFSGRYFTLHVAKMPRALIKNELTLLIQFLWGVSDLYTDHPKGNFL